jgi:peptidoglycan-N-acetylglucosamine deacetylase
VPRVALTFDDGPGPITAELLDILRDGAWPATFFVLGRNIDEAPWCGDPARARAIVTRMLGDGHVVGNHTWSHAQPDEYLGFARDLARCDDVIRARRRDAGLAEDAPIPFRLPYGVRLVERVLPVDTGTLAATTLDPRLPILASLGRTHVHWTSDFNDWAALPTDGPDMCRRMVEHVERMADLGLDAVLDLHDSGTGSSWGYARGATLIAVSRFIEQAKGRGWTPFTVPC